MTTKKTANFSCFMLNPRVTIMIMLMIPIFAVLDIFAQYTATIRVMTYNINAQGHGAGSYEDIANVIKEINPTIVGLQKVDSCNARNPIDIGKWLGEQTDLYCTFAPAIIDFNGSKGSYGLAFLTKDQPLQVRRLRIINTANEEDRAALEIKNTFGGEIVRVIVTHLAHEGVNYRTEQIKKIISWMDSGTTATIPTIIMADFNAKPTENCMKLLEDAGFVYVKGKNGEILDTSTGQGINHILYRPESRWKVIDAGNPYYNASNRNPVWADMELLNPPYSTIEITKKSHNILFSDRTVLLSRSSLITFSIYDLKGRNTIALVDNYYKNYGGKVFLNNEHTLTGTYLGIFKINNKKIVLKKPFYLISRYR